MLRKQRGSHQQWLGPKGERITLTADFPRYQMDALKEMILGGKK